MENAESTVSCLFLLLPLLHITFNFQLLLLLLLLLGMLLPSLLLLAACWKNSKPAQLQIFLIYPPRPLPLTFFHHPLHFSSTSSSPIFVPVPILEPFLLLRYSLQVLLLASCSFLVPLHHAVLCSNCCCSWGLNHTRDPSARISLD